MSTLLERVDIDRISAEARQVQIGRTLLTLMAAVLYVVGWITAKVLIGIWIVAAWTFTAVRLGWQDAWSAHRRRPQAA